MARAAKSKPGNVKPAAEIHNTMQTVVDNLSQGAIFGGQYRGVQLSQTDTQYINLRNYLISNNRQLLSEMYVEHGLVQTLIDQPVDDAFRAGFDIKSSQLDADDVEAIFQYAESNNVFKTLQQSMKWCRLFGGGGVLIITGQPADMPLDIKKLHEHSLIEFRACDMWELYQFKNETYPTIATEENVLDADYYTYRGIKVHPSRVLRVDGKEAPSFTRPRLRGWGMSEVEKIVRSLNQYMKNQLIIFELLDQAKIDVYRIEGLTGSLLSSEGSANVTRRIMMANQIKNFTNAIMLDKEDEYAQKQMAFSGLGEMLTEIRQGLACDLKMPITKLFGISSAGFNSGEDDIENYNSMIEGEIRSKCKGHIITLVQIICQRIFGMMPDDLTINFKPLRILSAEQEETVKTQQFNRSISTYQSGLIQDFEFKEMANKASLLPIEIDETLPANEPVQGDFLTSTSEKKVDA